MEATPSRPGIVLSPLPDLSTGSFPLPTSISTTTIPESLQPRLYQLLQSRGRTADGQGHDVHVGYVGNNAVRPCGQYECQRVAPGAGSAGGLLSQMYGANYTGTINALNPFKDARYDSLQTTVNLPVCRAARISGPAIRGRRR